jgi:hypothetical protein
MRIQTARTWIVVTALVFLLGVTGSARALPADAPASRSVAALAPQPVSPLLQYQGRLTDPGTGDPVPDGTYQMTFRLWNAAAAGTALWTETKDVAVTGGLFSTALGDTTTLNASIFSGQALWLGIQVRSDPEAAPRQQILPVAYAFSLVPGAVIESSAGPALTVRDPGGATALVVEGDLEVTDRLLGGTHVHSGGDINTGTVADARVASTLARDSEIMPTVLASDGSGSGLDADIVDGYHGSDLFALNENETVNGIPRLYGGTSGSTPPFYVDSTYNVAGLNADYLDGWHASSFVLNSYKTRYVPISAGDLMYSTSNTVYTGDCCNGILFVNLSQSGGSITFPLPGDYVYNTNFLLDLYLIPLTAGTGSLDFYVRWTGLSNGSWSGTGSGVTATPVTVGTANYIHKQSFTLSGFSSSSPPEIVELTIRRQSGDSYAGDVNLVGLRLAYTASY